MSFKLSDALHKFYNSVGIQYSISNEDYETLTWKSDLPKPTLEDLQNKVDEMNSFIYIQQRKSEYPTTEECVHALLDGGDALTELQAKRTAIKEKYPKPSE